MSVSPAVNCIWKSVILNSVFTISYVSLLIYYLIRSSDLFIIGKRLFFTYLRYLIAAEFVKLVVKSYFNSVINKRSNETKKNTYFHRKFKDFFKCTVAVFGSVLFFYITAVLFGAPVLSDHEETLMFSLLLSALIILPTYLHLGWENGCFLLLNLQVSQEEPYAKLMQNNIIVTLWGTWISAVVIPLDWDRPWQEWPIPCCSGALIGYSISHFIIILGYFFKSFDFLCYFKKKTGKYRV